VGHDERSEVREQAARGVVAADRRHASRLLIWIERHGHLHVHGAAWRQPLNRA
jgi:hypothetical protein